MINTNPIFNIIKDGAESQLTPNSVSVTLQFGNADVSNEANTSSTNRDIRNIMVSVFQKDKTVLESISQGEIYKISFSEGNNLHTVDSKVVYKGIEKQNDEILTVVKFEPVSGAIDEMTLKNGGSGPTGDVDYPSQVKNKPSINNITLVGNQTSESLGLTSLDVFTEEVSTLNNAIKDNTKHIDTLNSQYDNLNINKVDTDLLNVNVGEGKENKVLSFDASGNPKFVEQGGSETINYESLINQPQVNGVTLLGNKTSADLSLASSQELSETNSNLQLFKNYVDSALTKKEDELDLILNDNVKVELSNGANNIQITGIGKPINFNQELKVGGVYVATKQDLVAKTINSTTTEIKIGNDLAANNLVIEDGAEVNISASNGYKVGVNNLFVENNDDDDTVDISSGYSSLKIENLGIIIKSGNYQVLLSVSTDGNLLVNGKKVLTE